MSTDEIEKLKSYISKKGFKELDLQYEILDHLACQIEESIAEDPALSFDKALSAAHQGFGIYGFSVIEDAMRKGLEKQYWSEAWNAVKSCFRFPALFLLIAWAVLLFQSYLYLPFIWMSSGVLVTYLATQLYLMLIYKKPIGMNRHTLIGKAQLLYTVLIPSILFQVFVQICRGAEYFLEGLSPLVVAGIFTTLTLICTFSAFGSWRVMQLAVLKYENFQKRYGAIA